MNVVIKTLRDLFLSRRRAIRIDRLKLILKENNEHQNQNNQYCKKII